MIWQMEPFIIDIFVVFWIIMMMIIGYVKGFGVRLYDCLSSFGAVIAALFLSAPLSQLFVIYHVDGLFVFVGQWVNRMIMFFIVFIVLKLILAFLGHFIKPMLKGVLHFFSLTKLCDRLLGALLSGVEALVLIYIVVMLVISPLVSGGKEMVEQTIITHTIVSMVPHYTDQMMALSEDFEVIQHLFDDSLAYDGKDSTTVYNVTVALQHGYQNGLLSKDQLIERVNDYYGSMDTIVLSNNQYQEFENLLKEVEDEMDIQVLLKKVVMNNNE